MNTITIEHDHEALNPRTEYDNFGTMVCFHNRYELGDKHNFTIEQAKGFETSKEFISLPLYLYDHSGITMATKPFHCPWDSGQVGVMFIEKSKVRFNHNVKRITKKIMAETIAMLEAEVVCYDQFLTGDVWQIVERDDTGEIVDMYAGYYGKDFAEQEAEVMRKALNEVGLEATNVMMAENH